MATLERYVKAVTVALDRGYEKVAIKVWLILMDRVYTGSSTISAEDVSYYLREHPDFAKRIHNLLNENQKKMEGFGARFFLEKIKGMEQKYF